MARSQIGDMQGDTFQQGYKNVLIEGYHGLSEWRYTKNSTLYALASNRNPTLSKNQDHNWHFIFLSDNPWFEIHTIIDIAVYRGSTTPSS